MRRGRRLFIALLAPVLLAAAGALAGTVPAGLSLSPSPSPATSPSPTISPTRATGWLVTLRQASRLADDLAQYPVRQEAFRRCARALAAAQETIREAERTRGTAGGGRAPDPGLAERAREGVQELVGCRDQVREVAHEFGKGLELSYEGAFADFSARAEELADLLSRLALVLEAAAR
jgi:hypothetical protein